MNAYLFIVNGEAILIAARSMNDAEQAIIAEYEDVPLSALKDGKRLYTRGVNSPVRTRLPYAIAEVENDSDTD